jgi:hypothetical protein
VKQQLHPGLSPVLGWNSRGRASHSSGLKLVADSNLHNRIHFEAAHVTVQFGLLREHVLLELLVAREADVTGSKLFVHGAAHNFPFIEL